MEKRTSTRIDINLPATFKVQPSKSINFASIQNISVGGICFFSIEKLKEGQKLSLKIELPPDEEIVLPVEIRWVKEVDVVISPQCKSGAKIASTIKSALVKYAKFCKEKLKEKLP